MVRSILVAFALASLLAPGCSKSKSANESSAGSAAAGSASPTGSGSSVDTAAIDTMINDMMAYTEQFMPMMLAFDGDCGAYAKRMLELEPLAIKIRAEGRALEADTAAQAAIASKQPEVMARLKAKLEAAGTTEEATRKAEKAINDKCGSDPAFQDAMNHVGLRKKKR